MIRLFILTFAIAAVLCAKGKSKAPAPSALDIYVAESMARNQSSGADSSPASLYSGGAALGALALDLRPRRPDDILTIVVSDRASALSRGTVRSARNSSANASIDKLLGIPGAQGALPNLVGANSNVTLDGEGETARENVLSTTLTARVTHVLPNGYLVVEGTKNVTVNAETQIIKVRGVVRPYDINVANAVFSNQLGQLEVTVNGRGVVGDAIRRPNFLYRILLGVLPF